MESKSVWRKRWVDEGVPSEDDFEIVSSTVESDDLGGGVLVNVKAFSVDPYLRGGLKSRGAAAAEGRAPMSGFVSGVVLRSDHPSWEKGDLFGANLPFSTVQVVPEATAKTMWKLTGLVDEKNISYGIGVLGMPGSTAYAGLCGILRPTKGADETIFLSAASGAVASIAAQIAKNHYGCKVIGTAGGPEKVALLTEKYGYDVGIDYKKVNTKEDLEAELNKAGNIDMYFENVGGFQFDAAFSALKPGGRIAVCGQISNYNKKEGCFNEVNLMNMIYSNQRIEGFVCSAWLNGSKGNFLKDMSGWIKDGTVSTIDETFYQGVEQWPVAFRSLFTSGSAKNKGKVVVLV
mmetsp:Transcript_3470/g.9400  ORF Transcript_3470/g.9400 Transcript_3470/m.9400 type:complete len:347 (-) Transcript_3470:135-1175(-)